VNTADVFMYENRMKTVDIVLRREGGE
jgi:hypothetical protein